MRPKFEEDIRAFGEAAKEELKSEEDYSSELDDFSDDLSLLLGEAARRQGTNLEIQKEIYEIQKRKQEIMRQLKEQLACLDDSECRIEKLTSERTVWFDEAASNYMYRDDNGQEQVASFGELITDIDWGVNYSIDGSAPRVKAKRYLVEQAKHSMRGLLDLQIIKSEAGGNIAHEYKQQAYRTVEEERESGVARERWGFVSEIIVKNFLKKLSLDKNLPFEILEADIFQDVEQKIDFIIRRKEKLRGVNVETDEKIKDIGVQFSVSFQTAGKKRYQVERSKEKLREEGDKIQDIALVIFPLTVAGKLKEGWQRSGRPAGGPDKFLQRQTARKLFTKLLKDIFKEEEIDRYWQEARGNFPES